jgi:hypothetical protein
MYLVIVIVVTSGRGNKEVTILQGEITKVIKVIAEYVSQDNKMNECLLACSQE